MEGLAGKSETLLFTDLSVGCLGLHESIGSKEHRKHDFYLRQFLFLLLWMEACLVLVIRNKKSISHWLWRGKLPGLAHLFTSWYSYLRMLIRNRWDCLTRMHMHLPCVYSPKFSKIQGSSPVRPGQTPERFQVSQLRLLRLDDSRC